MASDRMGVRCNVVAMVAVMVAVAGVLQPECEARPAPDQKAPQRVNLVVTNEAHQAARIIDNEGKLVGVVKAGAKETFWGMLWEGSMTAELEDGRKARKPCILRGHGRRLLGTSSGTEVSIPELPFIYESLQDTRVALVGLEFTINETKKVKH